MPCWGCHDGGIRPHRLLVFLKASPWQSLFFSISVGGSKSAMPRYASLPRRNCTCSGSSYRRQWPAAAFPGFPKSGQGTRGPRPGRRALPASLRRVSRRATTLLAERLIEQADKLKPNQADGWNLRGVVLLKEKALRAARKLPSATRWSAIPDFWAAQFNVAEVPVSAEGLRAQRGSRFEDLLSQTDRFKDRRKWEIVLYKTFLAYLFSGDEAGARKKLAKLSAAPGTNPVLVYAEAAVAFHRKDNAGCAKNAGRRARASSRRKPTICSPSRSCRQAGSMYCPLLPALLTGAGTRAVAGRRWNGGSARRGEAAWSRRRPACSTIISRSLSTPSWRPRQPTRCPSRMAERSSQC